MKKLIWVAGAVLAVSLLYPNGVDLSAYMPATVEETTVAAEPNADIVKALVGASSADRARIVGAYTGLKTVLNRDNGARINTTEKFEEVHANTLQLAIDQPGKYAGLDTAIEAVFRAAVQDENTDASVVNPVTPLMQNKLVSACDVVIASAK